MKKGVFGEGYFGKLPWKKFLIYNLNSVFLNYNFGKEKQEVINPSKIVCRELHFQHNTTWFCVIFYKMIGLLGTS